MLTTRNISLSFLNKRAVEIINKKISSHMKRTLVPLLVLPNRILAYEAAQM